MNKLINSELSQVKHPVNAKFINLHFKAIISFKAHYPEERRKRISYENKFDLKMK